MQRVGLESIRRFVGASAADRRSMLAGIDQQARQDFRRRYWKLLRRRGVPLVSVKRRERFLLRVADDAITQTVFVYGDCDFQLVERAHAVLARPGGTRVLVDIGANIGSICIPAVTRGFAARAIAIEPEPMNFGLLTVNVQLNDLAGRIELVHAALGDGSESTLTLGISSANFGDHQIVTDVEADRPTISVPATTLDDQCPELNPDTDLIWMDIQGYERHALLGATNCLTQRVPMVMELWPAGLEQHGTQVGQMVDLLSSYASFYDLAEDVPAPRPMSDLPDLWASLLAAGSSRYYTDVLFV